MEINLDGSFSIADLASVIMSFIALRIALKSRRSPLREMLYERQLNVFQELFDRIIEVEDQFQEWETEKQLYNNPKVLEEIEKKLFANAEEFQTYLHKVEMFIPKQMHRKFGLLLDEINDIRLDVFNKKIETIDVNKLGEDIFLLKNEIRRFMGLDNLASETHRLISK